MNKKAGVASTMNWMVATIIVIFVISVFVFLTTILFHDTAQKIQTLGGVTREGVSVVNLAFSSDFQSDLRLWCGGDLAAGNRIQDRMKVLMRESQGKEFVGESLLYRIKKIPSAGYTPDVLTVPFAFNYDKNLFRYGFVVDDKVISGFQTVQPDGSFKLDVGELGVAYPNIHREPIIADLTFVCSSIPNFDKVVTFFFYFGPDVFTPIGDYKQVLQEVKNL